MKRFFTGFVNPFSLALLAELLVLIVFPLRINKYTVKTIDSGYYANERKVSYVDLNSDNNSEKIEYFHNSLGSASLTISNENGVLYQWMLRGKFDFKSNAGIVVTGDRDNDSIKEVYIFTHSADSVLLSIIKDYRSPVIATLNQFITSIGSRNNKFDPYMLKARMDDLTGDGLQELIFGIGTGYSLYPRSVYAYDFAEDTLYKSPKSGYFLLEILQEDINGDSLSEIIPYGYAASNIHDTLEPFSDNFSWLMVLNRDLSFVFEPLRFPDNFSKLIPAVTELPGLTALYCPPESKGDSGLLLQINPNGKITRTLKTNHHTTELLSVKKKNGGYWLLLGNKTKGISVYNSSLQKIKHIDQMSSGDLFSLDINLDGVDEIVDSEIERRQLVIWDNDIKHPLIIKYSGQDENGILYSVRQHNNRKPQLYFQFGNYYCLLEYSVNRVYYLRFLFYVAIYLSILGFSLLVSAIQRNQSRKRTETEKKITSLQLQIIKNQLDPHFIMNAVNSIIVSLTEKNKNEAREQLMHFSRLHRSLLLSADKIFRSLAEELEFVENYLSMEKFRFKDRFDYSVNIPDDVNMETELPRMIIQIHVENALKHGIFPLKTKGMISIRVLKENSILSIEIVDNGVGRNHYKEDKPVSTGRGLLVMEKYIDLFNRHYPGKIVVKIEDLFDQSGSPSGTRVVLKIRDAV